MPKLNSPLSQALATCLANATIMYHHAHAFHWNVVGADFPEWHDKFAEIYDDVYGSLDPLAENIRKLGDTVPFTLDELTQVASVDDENPSDNAAPTLVASLLATNTTVLNDLNDAFSEADDMDEQGIANFLAERIDAHQRWNWQLSVTTVAKSEDAEIADWVRLSL
jgi:starvation-inducible DNA-binding protein